MLLIQAADFAFDFALANAGKSILANIAMMAITTNNSIKVKARLLCMSLYWPVGSEPPCSKAQESKSGLIEVSLIMQWQPQKVALYVLVDGSNAVSMLPRSDNAEESGRAIDRHGQGAFNVHVHVFPDWCV